MKKRNFFIALCLILIVVLCVTLAACNGKEYKVKFVGDGITEFSQTVKAGSTATEPTGIQRNGYTFVSWMNGEEKYDFDTPVNADITLTAEWEANEYTVTLNVDGTTSTKQVTFDESYNLGVAKSNEIKNFAGWKLEDGTLITNEAGQSLANWNTADNVTVYPTWNVGYKVVDGLTYTLLENDTLKVTGTSAYNFDEKIEILAEVGGKAVTTIGAMQNVSASEIKVPSSVTAIEASAFASNPYIEVVDLSEFAGIIGDNAFKNSEVKIIELGSTTSIGGGVFENAPISTIVIPATVTSIGDGALVSQNIVEIGFAGAFPTLGNSVFGDGRREDGGKVTIIASKDAWAQLAGVADDATVEEYNAAITAATGVQAATMFAYTDEEIAAAIAGAGIYGVADTNEVIYRGLGMDTVFYTPEELVINTIYDYTHAYKIGKDGISRTTYIFDFDNKTADILTANEKGEIIQNDVLYDYLGSEIVYFVPDNVTKIAGGACINNQTMRFLIIGDNVVEIGDFAFSMGMLINVSFGEGLKSIGSYAFFNQNNLMEAIFYSESAPTIGTAAFCNLAQVGVIPTFMYNSLTQWTEEAAVIYTPLSTYSYWGDPPVQSYVDAFNKSLEGIDGLATWHDNNDPDSEEETISYSADEKNGEFKTLRGSYYYNGKSKVYETDLGTLTMTGATSGWALFEFGEDSDFEGNMYAYYSNMQLLGYGDSDDAERPKKLEIFTGFNEKTGYVESFIVYGRFEDDKFTLRGDEGGVYGEIGQNSLSLDGFGRFILYKEDGTITEGDYTVNGTAITLGGVIAEIAFSKEDRTLTFNGTVMTVLGEEAGVYYDVNNAAKVTLDGKEYAEGEKTYSGKITIEYKGNRNVAGYVIDNRTVKFMLNGEEKKWEYSKTSDDILKGYYGANSTEYLRFRVVENTLVDTFVNETSTLALDGYFTATIDGNNTAYYRTFGETSSILLIVDGEVKIAYLDTENNTFSYATAVESGKWYVTTGANYAWYFDGKGNLLYFSSDEYEYGTYEYNADTKAISIVYKGNTASNDEKGFIDEANGIGTIVYNSGGSNSYVAISKTKFDAFGKGYSGASTSVSVYSFIAKLTGDDVVSTSPSFSIYKSGSFLFVNTYGTPAAIVKLDAALADGTVCEVEYTMKDWYNNIFTATYQFTFAQDESGLFSASAVPVNYYEAEGTVKSGDETYTVSWLDETHAIVWQMGSYGGSTLVYGEVKDNTGSSFTIGEYNVTGYGTQNANIERIVTPEA